MMASVSTFARFRVATMPVCVVNGFNAFPLNVLYFNWENELKFEMN